MSPGISTGPAGRWLLHSGIQQPSGGFARYYDATSGRNRAVSTEISGYAASALVWLFESTRDEEYLACARKTGCFLLSSWDTQLQTFPFEHPSPSSESEHLSYFFDCGIIIRGLLAVWSATGEDRLLEVARAAAHCMIEDFRAHQDYHPILNLPEKLPADRGDQWSRSSGCYQLKAALAWRDVAEITGDQPLRDAWSEMLESALQSHADFLPGVGGNQKLADGNQKVMDRLHPYCYFLEGLIPELHRPEIVRIYGEGLNSVAGYLQEIAPVFARSDVYAQLLRARLYAADRITIDAQAAECEANALAAFQMSSGDARIDGGFLFGRRCGALVEHVNPVSTVFGTQALEMWRGHQAAGTRPPCLRLLI